MTTTETLRRAAALMRERAQAATPGPWTPDPRAPHDVRGNEMRNLVATTGGMVAASENTNHIASWHPAVALAVADWLDREAALTEASSWYPDSGESLAVARAYLNEEPSP